MNCSIKCILVISVAIIFSQSINAQELMAIQTDRPDMTESAFTVPTGYFQLETGLMRVYINSTDRLNIHPTMLFKYGLSDNFELRLVADLVTNQSNEVKETQFLPIAIGVKIGIAEEKGFVPKTSFIGHLKIPMGGEGELSSIYYAPSFRFTMQHTLSDKISIGYNLGTEWSGNTAEPTFIYTLTSSLSLTQALAAYIELYGYAPQFNQAEHFIDGGFTYLIKNDYLLDISCGAGLTDNAPDFFISAGFSFRINTKRKA